MYNISVKESLNSPLDVQVSIEGRLILENIKGITTELFVLIPKYNSFALVVDNVKDIDLSFVQMLNLLEREIKGNQKKIEKKITLPETFIELFTNTGLSHFMS